MAGEGLMLPSGQGGLMRYSEEYPSRFEISPTVVVVLIAIVAVTMVALKIISS